MPLQPLQGVWLASPLPALYEPPLLAQLQEQLADPDRIPSLAMDPEDHSLEFHACPGRLRQVQIVRDRILQLMAAGQTDCIMGSSDLQMMVARSGGLPVVTLAGSSSISKTAPPCR